MNRFVATIGVALAVWGVNAAADDNVANGRNLYLGQPSASYPSGSIGCNGCHTVTDTSTQQNRLFRGAAGDPSLIDFAINNNPASTGDMRPLYGVGAPSELSPSDLSDLAAYINSVVNPGGTTSPAFKSSPASADFATVGVGAQSATKTFTVTNTGSIGTLMSVASSNNTEFLLAGGTCLATPMSLVKSGSCTVQVIFMPGVDGARSSTISILNNGTPNPLTINVAGAGGASAPPQASLSVAASASFGTQVLFVQGAPKILTIHNVGTATATIFSVISGNANEFPVTSTTCGGALAVNATCAINVAFSPSAAGARSATLSVSSDGVGSPQSIHLSGTGATAGGSGGGEIGTTVAVVEYYNAGINHYFITPIPGEIALLGKPPFDAWQPTGLTFNAFAPAGAPANSVGICRFFNDHFLGVSTHFYAPHGAGCETTIAQFPDWTLESAQLFNAYVPDPSGSCTGASIPVYRLFNNGLGGAPNHRFTTSLAVRQTMLDQGYTPEGFGIGVGMCVPQ
ncbi:MAG: choice-of-anchor D domain-containing protein [Betaproteobacteria bacterium]